MQRDFFFFWGGGGGGGASERKEKEGQTETDRDITRQTDQKKRTAKMIQNKKEGLAYRKRRIRIYIKTDSNNGQTPKTKDQIQHWYTGRGLSFLARIILKERHSTSTFCNVIMIIEK